MLFDLRGRGRRRTVQVIYVGLAILMGGSLVLLGVGTLGGGGGLLNAVNSNEGSGGVSYADQIKKYQKLTQEQPNNVSAWENLLKAQLHQAGSGEAYVTRNGVPTSKGKELYAQIARSWASYVALDSANPSPELAQQMVTVFDEEGLNQPSEAVKVLQIVVAARPESAALYSELAIYAYKAHNMSLGDLASEKAISLAPASQRLRLKDELAALKKNPSGTETQTTTSKSGQPFVVKRGANGSITATPATSSTTTGTVTTPASPSKK